MKTQLKKDTQSRAYCFTINNYEAHNFTTSNLEEVLKSFPSISYYCYSLEIGLQEKTPHIQGYFYCKNPIKFSTIKNKFSAVNPHFEKAKGSAEENKNYIMKSDKWADTEKAQTTVDGSFKEWGKLPVSRKGNRTDLEILYEMISENITNAEILKINPNYMKFLNNIDRTRQIILEDKFGDVFRKISCIYVYGNTNTNKTRTYVEKYGYKNVYRVTNYQSNAIWDGYKGEDVVIFEEYRSQVPISEILTWLEGYPNRSLKARYSDKVACYTKVIIISNIELSDQYPNIQKESPRTWKAFLRRIQKVFYHESIDNIFEYNSVDEYFNRKHSFKPVTNSTPFDKPKQK